MAAFDTLLIFPPFWGDVSMPYLALPALAGYLRAQGRQVDILDLNLAFHHQLIQSATFEKFLAEHGGPKLYALIPEARLRAFVAELDAARAVYRSEAFYDPEKLVWARGVLDKAYQLLSLIYYPSQIDRHGVLMRYDWRWPEQMVAAAQEPQANPFVDFYAQSLFGARQAPDLLGLSIADVTQILPATTLAYLARRHWPETHITVGGALFSKFAAGLAEFPEPAFSQLFHSAVRGEGELALLRLIDALESGNSLTEVPGLVWRDAEAQVHVNDPGAPLAMQDLTAPDFDGLPLDDYWAPELVLPLLGSKDCYWKDCVFCDHYVSYAPRYRLRKPSLVAEDMALLAHKHGARRFTFGDETMSPNYARHLSQELLARGLDVTWAMLSRLQPGFDAETCARLYAGGCRLAIFGLESANERVSQLMEKGTVNQTSLEVYRQLDAAGIFTFSFVFFGFPTETAAEAQATLDFALGHKDVVHSLGSGTFQLKKAAPMFRNPQKYGIYLIDEDDLRAPWTVDVGFEPMYGLSPKEAEAFNRRFVAELWQAHNHPLWLLDNTRSTLFLYASRKGLAWLKRYHYPKQVDLLVV